MVAVAAIAGAAAVAAPYPAHPTALAQGAAAALHVLPLLKGRRGTAAVEHRHTKSGTAEAGVTSTETGGRGVGAGRK